MVHLVTLIKPKDGLPPGTLDRMMLTTRIRLSKIPEVLSVRCGKNLDPQSPWPFFFALEFESLERLAMTRTDAIYMKFQADVIQATAAEQLSLCYDAEPGKHLRFA